jgi:hypothetical protein
MRKHGYQSLPRILQFTVSEAVALPPLLDASVTVYVPSHKGAGKTKLTVRLWCGLREILKEKLSE